MSYAKIKHANNMTTHDTHPPAQFKDHSMTWTSLCIIHITKDTPY